MVQSLQHLTDTEKLAVLAQLQALVDKLWIQSSQRRLVDEIQRGVSMLLNSLQLDMQRQDAELAKKELMTKEAFNKLNGAAETATSPVI